ncbi:MAG: MGMT family protein [Candidatus Gracilibacteria bacterium]|nr:MGMT family protein [Candidatus Peregrinibacteria bacterium]
MKTQSPKSFTERVHEIVAQIPKGEVLTYKQVAIMAGKPQAARAVGMIMSKNRSPKIPCHRVIRTDGKMGGYAMGGIERKKQILKEEGYEAL